MLKACFYEKVRKSEMITFTSNVKSSLWMHQANLFDRRLSHMTAVASTGLTLSFIGLHLLAK